MLRVDTSEVGLVAGWLDDLADALLSSMPAGTKAGAEAVRARAEGLAGSEGIVGATRQYIEGWRADITGGVRVDGAEATVYNLAPYAGVIEEGRDPGKAMPPKGALLDWLRAKGLPEEAEFPIRRAIGRRGTKGRFILEQAGEQGQDEVFGALEDAFDLAMRRML